MELSADEVAYIGDDLIDLPILSRVGLAIVPSDAMVYVKPIAHYISRFEGEKECLEKWEIFYSMQMIP